MVEVVLVSRVSCDLEYIDRLNSMEVDYIIGLGDIECPLFINNYYGIIGEMENFHVARELKKAGKLIYNKFLDFSTSDAINTIYYISHYLSKTSMARKYKYKIAFYGHYEYSKILNEKEWIIGSFLRGSYVLVDVDKEKVYLQHYSH